MVVEAELAVTPSQGTARTAAVSMEKGLRRKFLLRQPPTLLPPYILLWPPEL